MVFEELPTSGRQCGNDAAERDPAEKVGDGLEGILMGISLKGILMGVGLDGILMGVGSGES